MLHTHPRKKQNTWIRDSALHGATQTQNFRVQHMREDGKKEPSDFREHRRMWIETDVHLFRSVLSFSLFNL